MDKKRNVLGIMIKIFFLGIFSFYEYKMYEEYKISKKNIEYNQKNINENIKKSFLVREEKFYANKEYQAKFDNLKKTVPENEIPEEFQGGIVFE